jgi:hypothetical protein
MYKLLKKEVDDLDNYWIFINHFYVDTSITYWINGIDGYRKNLIYKIREKYTVEDFYKYEKILNKLLWNLIEHVQFNIDELNLDNKHKLYEYISSNIIRKSYSHKQYLYNMKKNIKYYFKFYEELNNFESIKKILYIIYNKTLYQKIMKNKKYFDKLNKYSYYYYPLDYPFPNVNLLFYNQNDKYTWIEQINKLYFNGEKSYNKIDKNWYLFSNNDFINYKL